MSNYEDEQSEYENEEHQNMLFEEREGSPISAHDIFSDDENLEDLEE